jgi:hypothetical protein
MHDSSFELVVGPIAKWPDDHVRRAYKLLTGTVHRLHRLPLDEQIASDVARAEDEAEMYGRELLRRGVF